MANRHITSARHNTCVPKPAASYDRRQFVRAGLAAGAAIPSIGALLSLSSCADSGMETGVSGPQEGVGVQTPLGGPKRSISLVAEVGEVEVGPGHVYRTWLYNGQFPGPEIRAREGELLSVKLENRLPEGTTVHWHGVPLANPMDGVPYITQDPVASGDSFLYEFPATPAGTYFYHSHMGLQLDRGVLGPLVIEETTPHVSYDREYTILLDDLLEGDPSTASDQMHRGMRGRMGDPSKPEYSALLINGRTPADPPVFEVRRNERVRLRLINAASATSFRVTLTEHQLTVVHADGRPVVPVTVDAITLGMGERYDVIVEADNPGSWLLAATSLDGTPAPARATLRYAGTSQNSAQSLGEPPTIWEGRTLRLSDLVSVESNGEVTGGADRHLNLVLSGGMMSSAWTINGQAYPDAAPLNIQEGERVQVAMQNMSMIDHPMHLHGHFFRVGNALKDTVVVPAHMGRVVFEFIADNPGDWFFHCHNLYHMEMGMARVFRYV
jgi:multicopper oxidase